MVDLIEVNVEHHLRARTVHAFQKYAGGVEQVLRPAQYQHEKLQRVVISSWVYMAGLVDQRCNQLQQFVFSPAVRRQPGRSGPGRKNLLHRRLWEVV